MTSPTAEEIARKIVNEWDFDCHAVFSSLDAISKREMLQNSIAEAIKQAQADYEKGVRDTWAVAAKRASECMKHYDSKWGDPSGCLMGLNVEFAANADGKGPDKVTPSKTTIDLSKKHKQAQAPRCPIGNNNQANPCSIEHQAPRAEFPSFEQLQDWAFDNTDRKWSTSGLRAVYDWLKERMGSK